MKCIEYQLSISMLMNVRNQGSESRTSGPHVPMVCCKVSPCFFREMSLVSVYDKLVFYVHLFLKDCKQTSISLI